MTPQEKEDLRQAQKAKRKAKQEKGDTSPSTGGK